MFSAAGVARPSRTSTRMSHRAFTDGSWVAMIKVAPRRERHRCRSALRAPRPVCGTVGRYPKIVLVRL